MTTPNQKYRPFPAINMTERALARARDRPSARTWCSVDLRDGDNQALAVPMSVERKNSNFRHCWWKLGFKEIEIGFPLCLADRIRFHPPPGRGEAHTRTTSGCNCWSSPRKS